MYVDFGQNAAQLRFIHSRNMSVKVPSPDNERATVTKNDIFSNLNLAGASYIRKKIGAAMTPYVSDDR